MGSGYGDNAGDLVDDLEVKMGEAGSHDQTKYF